MIRKIIKIDKEKCNGCGACASACHEGAIDIIDGKAELVREHFCDGLGDCLPECPTGAISFEERDAPAYDEEAVKEEQKKVLMIMPGTAYDARGYRMGYGGGYYDRYLNAHEAEWKMIDFMTVFAAFSEQKMILIPGERCDVKPDVIVTEKEIMQRK